MKLAEAIADDIWQSVSVWNDIAKRTVGGQIIRASDSIGADIAESTGRIHYADATRFFYIARGSLVELQYWLRVSVKRNLLSNEKYEDILKRTEILAAKLNAFIKGKSRRHSNHQAI